MIKFSALLALACLAQGQPPPGKGRDQAFPDFLLPSIDGGHGRLSDYRGKKVLLFNFASW